MVTGLLNQAEPGSGRSAAFDQKTVITGAAKLSLRNSKHFSENTNDRSFYEDGGGNCGQSGFYLAYTGQCTSKLGGS